MPNEVSWRPAKFTHSHIAIGVDRGADTNQAGLKSLFFRHILLIVKEDPYQDASSSEEDIPEEWQELLGLAGEVQLPRYLPVKWATSSTKQQLIAFDPKTNKTYRFDQQQGAYVEKAAKTSPIGFITLTRGQKSMPGTETPAAVRFQRFGELSPWVIEDAHEKPYLPCIAHGDYVKVEALQSDHLLAKERIRQRQVELVEKLNADPEFATFIMKQPGMDKFFIGIPDQADPSKVIYYGTVFFYQVYFNDIDNIWLICQACNLHKSNEETVDWIQKQWLYGDEFVEYLQSLTERADAVSPILEKLNSQEGVAQIAIEWFWRRHGTYMSLTKRVQEVIVKPITILNRKIDQIVGKGQEKRALRHQEELDFKLRMIEEIIGMKGFRRPPGSSESPQSSSDEIYHSFLPGEKRPNPDAVVKARNEVQESLVVLIKGGYVGVLSDAQIEEGGVETKDEGRDIPHLPESDESEEHESELKRARANKIGGD